jgi:hypothetical protein
MVTAAGRLHHLAMWPSWNLAESSQYVPSEACGRTCAAGMLLRDPYRRAPPPQDSDCLAAGGERTVRDAVARGKT